MAQTAQNNKTSGKQYKNPYEALLSSLPKREAQKAPQEREQDHLQKQESIATGNFRREFTIFKQSEHYEDKVVPRQLAELMKQLKLEIADIKKRNQSMIQEVERIENQTLQSLPEKVGIYHVRFAEILLELLRSFKVKMGEANTWLTAMMGKKKKRGSAFVVQSKKKGTQFSLSQELQNARNVM